MRFRSDARERVLAAAEALFAERGFADVTMRNIADVLEMRQASLYHHAPGGKEQLYAEVFERGIERHRRGIEAAIDGSGPGFEACLRSVSRWFLSQPPLSLLRTTLADLRHLDPELGARLHRRLHEAVLEPLERCAFAALERGEIHGVDPAVLAGVFVSAMDSIAYAARATVPERYPAPELMADQVIELFLRGVGRLEFQPGRA